MSVRADAKATRIKVKMRIAKLHSTFDNHSAMDFIQGRRSGRTQRRKGRRGRQILLVVLASLREIGLYLAHVCTCLMIHWTRQSCYDSITSLASKSIATLVSFDAARFYTTRPICGPGLGYAARLGANWKEIALDRMLHCRQVSLKPRARQAI